ncbi:uncharacterized protein LOC143301916 [Babylonia areolata]|uniref:uncharacterized protein LOC143301916 n=1 Tax=Babylonia areolata TaxID=304850 RepID=UPI003FD31139
MVLSPFSSRPDDTRLVRHRDTVYKVKVVFAAGAGGQGERRGAEDVLHSEVEEVLRAVIFMVENDRDLVKVQTQHLLVAPTLKVWKTGRVLGFRQHGKELNVFSHVLVLNVTSCQQHRKGAPESASTVVTSAAAASGRGAGEGERGSADPVRRPGGGGSTGRGIVQNTTGKSAAGSADPVRRPGERGSTGSVGKNLQNTTGKSTAGSAGPVRGPGEEGSAERAGKNLQQNGPGKSAAVGTGDASGDRNQNCADVNMGPSQPAVCATSTSAASVRSLVAQPRAPDTAADSLAQPSLVQNTGSNQTARKDGTSSAKPNSPSSSITRSSIPRAERAVLPTFTTTGTRAGAERSSTEQRSTDTSSAASPRRTRSRPDAQNEAAHPAVRMQSSSDGRYNLRSSQSPKSPSRLRQEKKRNVSSDSPKSPSRLRQEKRRNDNPPPSGQGRGAGAVRVSDASPSRRSGSQSARASVRSSERSRVMRVSSRRDQAPEVQTSSSFSKKPRQPLRLVHSGGVTTRGRQNIRRSTSLPASHPLHSPRSRLRRQHHNQQQLQARSSRSISRDRRRRTVPDRPAVKAPPTAPSQRYHLRQAIRLSSVMEEQRLRNLATRSDDAGPTTATSRTNFSRRAVRSFQQKDRHLVEVGDVQEEQKLQAMANAHDPESVGTAGPRGTKRRGGVLGSLTGGVVAPLKRALRAYRDVV